MNEDCRYKNGCSYFNEVNSWCHNTDESNCGYKTINKNGENTQTKIDRLMFNFGEFLKEKNRRYGDSVINPVKIFSKVEPDNKACIRLDEKLQRITNNDTNELRKNDVCDTFGYLALLMIDKGWLNFEEMLD